MKNKLVTIGIPVYNGAKFISETLESIINQTYKNLEIIVSDNGSNDTTVEIVKEFMKRDSRISLNQNLENLGYSGNLNKIIELASSEYIAIYHADDVYESTIVEEQVRFLGENEELAGCFTLGEVINERGNPHKSVFYFDKDRINENTIVNWDLFIEKICKIGNMFICPTSMIKKSVYLELNGYDSTLKYIEDQDMWIRILEKYKLGILAKDLFKYRIHSNQGSNYYTNMSRQKISVDLLYLKKYLNKHRENINILNLNKRIALDYIFIAKNSIYLNNYEKFQYFLKKSRYYYRSPKNIKIIFLRLVPNYILYIIGKLIIKMESRR